MNCSVFATFLYLFSDYSFSHVVHFLKKSAENKNSYGGVAVFRWPRGAWIFYGRYAKFGDDGFSANGLWPLNLPEGFSSLSILIKQSLSQQSVYHLLMICLVPSRCMAVTLFQISLIRGICKNFLILSCLACDIMLSGSVKLRLSLFGALFVVISWKVFFHSIVFVKVLVWHWYQHILCFSTFAFRLLRFGSLFHLISTSITV